MYELAQRLGFKWEDWENHKKVKTLPMKKSWRKPDYKGALEMLAKEKGIL